MLVRDFRKRRCFCAVCKVVRDVKSVLDWMSRPSIRRACATSHSDVISTDALANLPAVPVMYLHVFSEATPEADVPCSRVAAAKPRQVSRQKLFQDFSFS